MVIQELALENVLSFAERTVLGPFGTVNALVGKNNVGKSNVFRALRMFARWHSRGELHDAPEVKKLWHGGELTVGAAIEVAVSLSEDEWTEVPRVANLVEPGFSPCHRFGMRYQKAERGDSAVILPTLDAADDSRDAVRVNLLNFVCRRLLQVSAQRRTELETVQQADQTGTATWDGRGLKAWLNQFQSGRTVAQQRAAADLSADIRRVAGFEDVELQVFAAPGGRFDVLVSDGSGFRSSLEDCGVGLQMVLVVLGALHAIPGAVVLVDDPEAHLHPTAQSSLAKTVASRAEASGGQVIFATHSPSIVDIVPATQIFEIRRESGASCVRGPRSDREVHEALRELGYRPSLLRMAETILFVEGPSDEAAVRAWWRTLFDEEPEPAVSLLLLAGDNMRHIGRDPLAALGRTCFALLDSDRSRADEPPSGVALEFCERLSGVVETHILSRRALENYFSPSAIQRILRLPKLPSFSHFQTMNSGVPNYGKRTHAGRIASEMTAEEIPQEIQDFLKQVHGSAHV